MIVWLDTHAHNSACPFGFSISFDHALANICVIVDVYLMRK